MHNAANNTEKYEGKSPLWESALLCVQRILFPRPLNRLPRRRDESGVKRGWYKRCRCEKNNSRCDVFYFLWLVHCRADGGDNDDGGARKEGVRCEAGLIDEKLPPRHDL